jgi:hypothetical protein
MADFKLKPSSGSKFKLQQDGGTDALTVDTLGNIQLAGTMTTGTMTSGVSVPQEVIAKIHTFTFGTRTNGSGSELHDQFEWANQFTPLDPVNNSFWVMSSVPTEGTGNDFCGYGLRFKLTSSSLYSSALSYMDFRFIGKGSCYVDPATVHRQSTQSYAFTIPAEKLVTGTYTLTHFTESASSNPERYCPDVNDDARIITPSKAYMMITEYKNI